jgi:hypothetical protein
MPEVFQTIEKPAEQPKKVMEVVTFMQVGRYIDRILRVHIVVIASWLILGAIHAPIAEGIATLISPVANLAALIYPKINTMWHGTFSPSFYRAIVSEVFLVACIQTALTLFQYLGKSWSKPCLLIEAISAQFKTPVYSFTITLIIILLSGFAWLSWFFILPIWFGVIQPQPQDPILLHQLGLWALLTPMSGVAFLYCVFIISSYLAYVGRSIFRLFKVT